METDSLLPAQAAFEPGFVGEEETGLQEVDTVVLWSLDTTANTTRGYRCDYNMRISLLLPQLLLCQGFQGIFIVLSMLSCNAGFSNPTQQQGLLRLHYVSQHSQ